MKDKLTDAELAAIDGDFSKLGDDYAADMPVPSNEPSAEQSQAKAAEPAAAAEDENKQPEGFAPAVDAAADAGKPPAEENKEPAGDGKVNYGALKEERERRKALERQVEELNQKFSLASQRLDMVVQARQTAQPQPEKPKAPPSPKDDLMGATEYAIQRISEFDRQAQMTAQQRQQMAEQQRVQSYVLGEYSRAAAERASADPTFSEAQNFLLKQRFEERIAAGQSEQEAYAGTQRDEYLFAEDAVRNRVNPADRIVAVAKARGWQPKAPETATVAPSVTDADKLATIAAGQAAAASLSTAGTGGAAKSKIDAKALGEMSDKEFAAWLAKNGDEGFREVVGH